MTRSMADIKADLALIDEQIRPLTEMRRDLHREYEAARDAYASSNEATDLDLSRLSADSRAAADRIEAAMQAMHPAMRMLTHWMPIPDDYAVGYFAAPNLTLDYTADDAYVTSLAAALIEFAQRFVPTMPEAARHGDLVFADVLDHGCGEFTSYEIWFEPIPGGRGRLVTTRDGSASEKPLRPLPEVISEACKRAWFNNGPQRNDDEEDYQ